MCGNKHSEKDYIRSHHFLGNNRSFAVKIVVINNRPLNNGTAFLATQPYATLSAYFSKRRNANFKKCNRSHG